jgi:hypothetical protein
VVFLDFAAAGLAVGLVLGGSVGNLGRLRVRWLSLAYVGLGLQVLAFPSGLLPWTVSTAAARILWLLSYVALGALVLRNARLPGIAIIGVGQVCNLAAITANGGDMPVTRGALTSLGVEYHRHNNSVLAPHPHLSWLIDRWAVPEWLPLGNVYSVGDVIIGIGLVVAIVVAMRPRLPGRRAPAGTTSP